MKIINKGMLLILVVVMLTSCNDFRSSPAVRRPTEVMETAMSFVKTAAVETQAAIPTLTLSPQPPTPISPTPIPPLPTPFFSFAVDWHDPQSVIRAYFDALERSDSTAMASVLRYGNGYYFIFEPVHSIRILEINLKSDPSPTRRIYSVRYDIQWKGQERSEEIQWSFTLEWYANRDSWLITNYGYGME